MADDDKRTRRLLAMAGLRMPRLKRPLTEEEKDALTKNGEQMSALTEEMFSAKIGTATREQLKEWEARRKKLSAEQRTILAGARKAIDKGKGD